MTSEVKVSEQGLRELLLSPSSVWEAQFSGRKLGGVALMGAAFGVFADEQYDTALYNEEDAKHMIETLFITGAANAMSGALYSINGQGKSSLDNIVPYIIDGIGPKNVAIVPHHNSLTPAQLLGNKEAYKTKKVKAGQETEESIFGEQLGIINPDTKVVIFDEFDQTSPEAIAATRTFFTTGAVEVYTDQGPVLIKPVDLVLASFNHYGSIYGNVLEAATISRIALAVEMGRNEKEVSQRIIDNHTNIANNKKSTIKPVISKDNLEFMRARLPFVDISETRKALAKLAVNQIDETLLTHGINMGQPRLAEQLILASKAVALRSGRTEVNDQDVYDVSEYMLTAKLGGLGVGEPTKNSNHPNSLENLVTEALDSLKRKHTILLNS